MEIFRTSKKCVGDSIIKSVNSFFYGKKAFFRLDTHPLIPISEDGKSKIVMQGDDNIIIYTAGRGATLATVTNYKCSALNMLAFQNDGNLGKDGNPVWSVGFSKPGGELFYLIAERKVVNKGLYWSYLEETLSSL